MSAVGSGCGLAIGATVGLGGNRGPRPSTGILAGSLVVDRRGAARRSIRERGGQEAGERAGDGGRPIVPGLPRDPVMQIKRGSPRMEEASKNTRCRTLALWLGVLSAPLRSTRRPCLPEVRPRGRPAL